ncbi:MAG: LPS assembly protein LptD [Pseudomonadota bacterium]|jgi:Organic solvent tolerance protein OstA
MALLCLAASAGAQAADTSCPPQSPAPARTPPASTAPIDPDRIEIDSDNATLDADGDVALKGNVLVRQGDRELRAEDVQYDAADRSFRVEGTLEYEDPILSVRGGGGRYSPTEGAEFSGAEFELRERGARGTAGALNLSPLGVISLEDVSFTTCPVTDPAWSLRADAITLDTRTRLGTGRAARVDFKGVPLLYLPWLSFPLGTERKSGFLFPSIGHSSRSGLQLAVPYYWNIAPNADFTFEPVWYGRRGIDLSGELRYLSRRQSGGLSFHYLPEDRIADRYRGLVSLRHRTELPRDLRFTIDAGAVSDPEYFEDFAQGPEGTSIAFVERLARLAYRDEYWRFSAELQHFQTIERELVELERPYARVPRIRAGGDFGWGKRGILRYGFDSELVNFERSEGVTGWRFDVQPTLGLDIDGAGYFVRPNVSWRFTQYDLDGTDPGRPVSPRRSLPIASLDAGLVFERPAGAEGGRTVTLEPRMLYLYAPYRNQEELPLFDTALPDLNLVQLFRTNRYVGADRVSDANQVSVGITTRLLDADDGRQLLAATLGQTYYFESPRVQLPGETVRDRSRSDLVAQLALTTYAKWNVDLGLQWNPDDSHSERAQVMLQYRPDDDRVINFGYRQQRERLEQAEVSTAWPVGPRWSLYARYVYSLRDDESLERFAGFEYRACCWRLRMVGRRFVSRSTGEKDTGVYLQLELTGLASLGSGADAFLETAIRGYSPPDTTL